MLIGRDLEMTVLAGLLDRATQQVGDAVVVRGEAGIGKTTLLAHAAGLAEERGMRVVGTAGVQAEVHVPYAGLHRLLRALGAGARFRPEEIESPFTVAIDLLDLLGNVGVPVFVGVEDAHWLDPASWDALSFVARRVGYDPVAMVLTARDGEETDRRLVSAALPELRLEPLDGADSRTLLDVAAPDLRPALRERVLAESAGNPLGLVELGSVAARAGTAPLPPSTLPLTTRLERTFASLAAELPPVTRSLLLVAALDDSDDPAELLTACSRVEEHRVGVSHVEPAIAAGLVQLDDRGRLRFRHPLLRSAVRQSAPASQRRRVHAALAQVVAGDDDRQVWHLAAATEGPDEALAVLLTEMAVRVGERQAVGVARAALEKAVQLSEAPPERGRRLVLTAEAAAQQGDIGAAARLLDEVDVSQLRPADQAWLSYLREQFGVTGWSGNARLTAYAELVDSLARDGDTERAMSMVTRMALRFYWSNPDPATVQLYLTVADGIDVSKMDARMVAAIALIAPIERGAVSLERMAELRTRFDLGPAELDLLGMAAGGIGALDMSAHFYASAVTGVRTQGRIGLLAQVLTNQAFTAAALGDTNVAVPAATEAAALAEETGQRVWALTARLMLGHAEALRGNSQPAREAADLGESVLLGAGPTPMLALVQMIRGVEALAAGRPEDAYRQLRRIFDPQDVSYHPYTRFIVFGHLAEAAVLSGAVDELRALVAELEPVAAECRSPALEVTLRYAKALLAEDAAVYEAELARDLSGWAFERARLQLAYGAWLRRQRRAADSRPVLRSAAATFDALGVTPWADRARSELRATGESLRRPVDAGSLLTPQELQIARLAADGLSNRDIAGRLFLSPRTVTTHLYRIYPKLGIKSRVELVRVLAAST
jgi:DNA-binding CsgD family transcriptional regulator/energy-coupling factor transporter ATP-binding protein EcfA2